MFGQLMRRDGEQPGMIVVSGETGVGKTRLLDEFAIQASAQGAVTLCGGRGAHADQFACGAFAVALEEYAASRSEAERRELARAYPALARFVPSLGAGIPLPAPAPDLRDYYLDLFPSIVQFLMDLARTKPVLLVLGDLHEADAIGLDLIRYLAHLAVGTPLLMVGALRDPDIEADADLRQMIEAMTRERLWLRIDLHCLSRQATDQLVHAMLPRAHVSDDTLAQIYAQSRGNPLFVRELVEGMSAHGSPVAADEGCQDLSWLAARLPARRRILIGMRLALMDEPLRRVLGLAAAVGATEISLHQLRDGAAALKPPVDIPVLFDALDRALRLRLLEERGEGYAFRHPIVRAALYDCLPRHRRDELRAALTASRRQARTLDRPLSPISPVVQISAAVFQLRRLRLEEYWNAHAPSQAEEEISVSGAVFVDVLALLFLGTRSPAVLRGFRILSGFHGVVVSGQHKNYFHPGCEHMRRTR